MSRTYQTVLKFAFSNLIIKFTSLVTAYQKSQLVHILEKHH